MHASHSLHGLPSGSHQAYPNVLCARIVGVKSALEHDGDVHACICRCIHIYVDACVNHSIASCMFKICLYVHTYVCMYIFYCIPMCVYIYIYIHMYMYMCIYTHTNTRRNAPQLCLSPGYQINTHTGIYTYTHRHTCTYTFKLYILADMHRSFVSWLSK
jgi:hypothetical protein